MSKFSTILTRKWLLGAAQILNSTISAVVFFFLDFVEVVLCVLYRLVDELLEGKDSSCYCMETEADHDDHHRRRHRRVEVDQESELSETIYRRKNMFKEMGFLKFHRFLENIPRKLRKSEGGFVSGKVRSRWSDCGCDNCVEWMRSNNDNDLKLHFVVKQPLHTASAEDRKESTPAENVIFLHGLTCSSSYWTETVFPNLLDTAQRNYRHFAVDLLGFGRSPKPRDCLYTMKDHLEMIEKSVICPFQLNSFHLVAHSMGCVIALALAAKYPNSVKTITILAPPYFPSKENGSIAALERLSAKRIWPPSLFLTSFMAWHEHLCRTVCFLFCRNHTIWESILKLLTRKQNLHHTTIDLTRHTHHSLWRTSHNVLFGGAKLMDGYLEVLSRARVKIHVFHGRKDQMVPVECSNNLKLKVENIQLCIMDKADHNLIEGREEEFTNDLEYIWASDDTDSK